MPDGTIELDVRLSFLQNLQDAVEILRQRMEAPVNLEIAKKMRASAAFDQSDPIKNRGSKCRV